MVKLRFVQFLLFAIMAIFYSQQLNWEEPWGVQAAFGIGIGAAAVSFERWFEEILGD